MVEISVVIPAYNAIDYMDEALDSIINQSFKDLEIICVDDGSTDNTLERLEYYASKDSRIQVYTQENQGPGGATNTGLSKAKGKYIYFMDSDDILDLNALEILHNLIEEKNVDFVIFKSINYDEDTGEYIEDSYFTMPELQECAGDSVFNWRDIGDTIFSINVAPWSKLYNHDFIKRTGAKFLPNLIYHDNLFFWDMLFNSDRVYFHNEFLYKMRVHSCSATHSNNEKSIQTIKTNNLVTQKFIDYGYFEDYKVMLYNRKIYIIIFRYGLINEEFKELFFIEMKKDFEKVIPHEKYDDFYSNLEPAPKRFFDNVIESDNRREFDLRNEIFDLKDDNRKLKNEVKSLKRKVKRLNADKRKLNKKVKKSNKKVKDLSELNKSISSSRSWKLTKPCRAFMNFFRKL